MATEKTLTAAHFAFISNGLQHWSKQQIREFAKELRATWRGGWPYFTTDVREAIVSAKVLSIVQAQAASTIEIAAIDELRIALGEALR